MGNLTRPEANSKLLVPGMPSGSFLVRKSQSKAGFALSVRSEDQVVHYHIQTLWSEEVMLFYINDRSELRFPSLASLVHHYQNKDTGLCCILTYPCSTAEQLVASGQYPQDTKNICGKDAQKTFSDAKVSSSLGARPKQAAGQYPQNTSTVHFEDSEKTFRDAKLSSSLSASQKQAKGNCQNHVSPTIFLVMKIYLFIYLFYYAWLHTLSYLPY